MQYITLNWCFSLVLFLQWKNICSSQQQYVILPATPSLIWLINKNSVEQSVFLQVPTAQEEGWSNQS